MKLATLVLASLMSFQTLAANILFDEAHKQAFSINRSGQLDLSAFGDVIKAQGHKLATNQKLFSDSVLSNVDAVIISGPFQPLNAEEMVALKNFVSNGGKLAVMIHISPTVGQLLAQLQINVSNYVVYERENILDGKNNSFVVKNLKKHAIFENLSEFNLYGGWALKAMDNTANAIATSSNKAWLDLNRNKTADSNDLNLTADLVIAKKFGQGEILVFADDAIFQNRFLTGNNKKLAENLAKWLSPTFI